MWGGVRRVPRCCGFVCGGGGQGGERGTTPGRSAASRAAPIGPSDRAAASVPLAPARTCGTCSVHSPPRRAAGDFGTTDLESDPEESLFGSSWLSRVYAATFMMLVVILLLNLLIAIINDT